MLGQTHIIRGKERDFLFFPATFSLYAIPSGLTPPFDIAALGPKGDALLEAEMRLHHRLGSAPQPPSAPTSLCLFLAQDCNLCCGYCYNKGGKAVGAQQRMPPEVAQTALSRFFTKPGESYAVSFYGGEPLLNRSTLEQTVAFGEWLAAERSFRISFHITTNGTLLDAEALRLLARFTTVTVSLDGPQAIHDRYRRDRAGAGSHDNALTALRALKSLHGPRVTIKGTLTAAGAARYNYTSDYLNSLGADAVGITPVFTSANHPAWIDDETYAAYVEEYLATHCNPEQALENPETHGTALELMRRILQRQRTHRHCHAGSDLAVAADGTLYACHGLAGEQAFRMGHVNESEPGVEYRLVAERFAALGVDTIESCRGCFARYLCGGGCYAHGHFFHGDPSRPDPRHCHLERKQLERVLAGLGEILQDPARRKQLQALIGKTGHGK